MYSNKTWLQTNCDHSVLPAVQDPKGLQKLSFITKAFLATLIILNSRRSVDKCSLNPICSLLITAVSAMFNRHEVSEMEQHFSGDVWIFVGLGHI